MRFLLRTASVQLMYLQVFLTARDLQLLFFSWNDDHVLAWEQAIFGSQPLVGIQKLYSPALTEWMFFNKGLDMTKKVIWDLNPDPRAVFSAFIYMDGRTGYEGVPGTAADAWGEEIVNYFVEAGKLPYEKQSDAFFPGEKNPAPAGTAIDDQLNLMTTDPNANNIGELLAKGEADYKAQLAQFASSISTEDFKAAAQKYYAYLDDHFKTNFPEFYQNRFKPYYESKVLPAIS